MNQWKRICHSFNFNYGYLRICLDLKGKKMRHLPKLKSQIYYNDVFEFTWIEKGKILQKKNNLHLPTLIIIKEIRILRFKDDYENELLEPDLNISLTKSLTRLMGSWITVYLHVTVSGYSCHNIWDMDGHTPRWLSKISHSSCYGTWWIHLCGVSFISLGI